MARLFCFSFIYTAQMWCHCVTVLYYCWLALNLSFVTWYTCLKSFKNKRKVVPKMDTWNVKLNVVFIFFCNFFESVHNFFDEHTFHVDSNLSHSLHFKNVQISVCVFPNQEFSFSSILFIWRTNMTTSWLLRTGVSCNHWLVWLAMSCLATSMRVSMETSKPNYDSSLTFPFRMKALT